MYMFCINSNGAKKEIAFGRNGQGATLSDESAIIRMSYYSINLIRIVALNLIVCLSAPKGIAIKDERNKSTKL